MPATPAHQREESQLASVWHALTSAMKAMTFLSYIPRGEYFHSPSKITTEAVILC